jgi:preprotein translocase subunit SecG
MNHHPGRPVSSLVRATAALAAAFVTCSLFYGVIAGMAGDTSPGTPLELSMLSQDGA